MSYIQFKIHQNRLVTQTLLMKMGESESESSLCYKEKDKQIRVSLCCPSTIHLWSNIDKWVRKDIQPRYKMCDWDKVLGNPKSSFHNKYHYSKHKNDIYLNRQTGKEMHVDLFKYLVYQQLRADGHKANLNMTMPKFGERWNIVYDSLKHFANTY